MSNKKYSKLKNLLYFYDYYSQPYEFYFEGFRKRGSLLGIIFTLITFGTGLGFLISEGKELFLKTKPKSNFYSIFEKNPRMVNAIELPMFSFSLQGNNKSLLYNEKYLKIRIDLFNQTRVNSTVKRVRTPLKWEKCEENLEEYLDLYNKYKKNVNHTETLLSLDIKNHICLKNRSFEIGGDFNFESFSNIQLTIEVCNNLTFFNQCADIKEINQVLGNENLGIYLLDSIVNINNSDSSFQSFIQNYFLKLDVNQYSQTDIYISKKEVFSDKGILFEDNSYESRYSYDYFNRMTTSQVIDNVIVKIYINISKNTYITKRIYMKVQEVVALLGGILKMCTFIGFMMIQYITRYKYDESMINLFFSVNLEGEKKENERKEERINKYNIERRKYYETQVKLKGIDKDLFHKDNNDNHNEKNEKNKGRIIGNIIQNQVKSSENLITNQKNPDFHRIKSYKKHNILSISYKKHYKISILDIIGMSFCYCCSKYTNKKRTLDIFQKQLRNFIDITEIVNTVIKSKHLLGKEFYNNKHKFSIIN